MCLSICFRCVDTTAMVLCGLFGHFHQRMKSCDAKFIHLCGNIQLSCILNMNFSNQWKIDNWVCVYTWQFVISFSKASSSPLRSLAATSTAIWDHISITNSQWDRVSHTHIHCTCKYMYICTLCFLHTCTCILIRLTCTF